MSGWKGHVGSQISLAVKKSAHLCETHCACPWRYIELLGTYGYKIRFVARKVNIFLHNQIAIILLYLNRAFRALSSDIYS